MDEKDADIKLLESFVVGNADLEKLEAMLDRFNIFEAVGMERQEIRHSRFLAFLLDPKQSHGTGDAFLKRFLQSAVAGSSAVVTQLELGLWNLGGTSVQREWNHIDIFLLDEANRLAVIVENKIGTREHSDQLNRYYELVREKYPDYRILAVYLTPNGDEPSHPDYLPLDYGTVCRILDEVNESKKSVMEPDASVLVRHYTDMMRRNIVGDSEVARLSWKAYKKHRRAIELMLANISETFGSNLKLFRTLIKEDPRLEFGYTERTEFGYTEEKAGQYIVFDVKDWNIPSLNLGDKYKNSNRILRFTIHAEPPSDLKLWLEISPGDETTRKKLFGIAHQNPTAFEGTQDSLSEWTQTYTRVLLPSEFYETASKTKIEAEIRRNWNDFLENDLPRIDAALRAEDWIWEDAPEPATD